MAKVKEVDCSQVEQTDEIGGGVGWTPGGAGAVPWRIGQGQRLDSGGSGNLEAHGRGPLFSSPLPHSVMLTVPQSGGLQSPKQLSADVFAVPPGLGQGLGHCKVKGIQIIAGRVRVGL